MKEELLEQKRGDIVMAEDSDTHLARIPRHSNSTHWFKRKKTEQRASKHSKKHRFSAFSIEKMQKYLKYAQWDICFALIHYREFYRTLKLILLHYIA